MFVKLTNDLNEKLRESGRCCVAATLICETTPLLTL